MNTRIFLAIAALMGVPACAEEESSETGAGRRDVDDVDIAPQSFVFGLDRATTAEGVIPQILKAGHPQLADACADYPGVSIRVFNPLALGTYTDVPCTLILSGDSATAEASAALVSDELDGASGEVRQEIGPISFLMCGLFAGATLLTTRYAICPRARTARNRQKCDDVGLWGGIGMGLVCSIPF